MARHTNHTGKKFNRLTAVQKKGEYYRCTCDCGGTALVRSDHLSSGHTKSCGCIKRELVQQRKQRVVQRRAERKTLRPVRDPHRSNIRAVWQQMIYRCTVSTCPEYQSYGAIGITVCNRWLESFDAFYADMRPTYKPGKSLDRRDNNLGYSPQNCRWATAKMQARNRRNTLYLWSDSSKKKTTLPAFAEKHGIPYHRAYVAYKKLAATGNLPWACDMRELLCVETIRPNG